MRNKLDEFSMYLREVNQASDNTVISYKTDVGKLITYLEENGVFAIIDITEDKLALYMSKLKESNLSQATIIRNYTSVKAFFKFLVDNGDITENPAENLKTPKAAKKSPRILTQYEVEELLSQPFKGDPKGKRDRAILELMYSTGLRSSEIISLKLSNLDMSLGCLRMDNNRLIPYGKKAKEALTEYLLDARGVLLAERGEGKQDDETLFLNYNGAPMSRQGLWKLIKTYVKRAGIDTDITPYDLRNSFVAHLIQSGADTASVQEIMGYSAGNTLSRYKRKGEKSEDPYGWARIRN